MFGGGDCIIHSGNMELDQKVTEWLSWDKNEESRAEVLGLCKSSSWAVLETWFLAPRLAFGTAGLRGIMRPGPAGMNELLVLQTAQGLLRYAQQHDAELLHRQGIVVGYDGRHCSKRFAEITSSIFLHAGIPVWLYEVTIATPFIPHAVLERKLAIGIMVTASHNPKEDNGYKVYWNNGAQILPPHDKNIQNIILEHLEPWKTSWDDNILKSKSDLLRNPFNDSMARYYKALEEIIPDSLKMINENSELKFVYTAMHGVGYPYIKRAFEAARLKPVIPVKEQQHPNPDFPTVKFPNPEEGKSSLDMSIRLANKMKCNIILANDPDADRLACAEIQGLGDWHVFTGNELGALLGWWSLEVYKLLDPNLDINDIYMLASTVSSKILFSMSQKEGFHFIETLTGFKWMGNETVKLLGNGKKVLFAFEEAIGFMWGTNVLDKDGVSAAALLATLACYLYDKQKITLKQQLTNIYKKYGYHATDNSYYICHDRAVINKIFGRLRNFPGSKRDDKYPHAILNGKYEIERVQDLTTGYDSTQGRTLLPSSKSSEIITFSFKNGFMITLRTSGTEPKLKYYSEMCAKPELRDWEALKSTLKEMVTAACNEFLQPEENGLISRID